MKKSVMVSGMNFGTEFLINLYKEVVKKGGTEEGIFESLKTGSDLIPKFAEMIVGEEKGVKKLSLKYLKFIANNIVVKTDSFSKNSFFSKKGPIKLYFGDNFSKWVLEEISETVPAFEGTLRKTQLTELMYDSKILSELGQPQPFTVSDFAAIIHDLLLKQPEGKDGQLLNNGYANIFSVKLEDGRVVAVVVYWYSDAREWGLCASGLDDVGWNECYCVFSRS